MYVFSVLWGSGEGVTYPANPNPNLDVRVGLKLCVLWPPIFLTKVNPCFADRLQELKEKEKDAEYFTKMPSKHYMEIASLLLNRYFEYNMVN